MLLYQSKSRCGSTPEAKHCLKGKQGKAGRVLGKKRPEKKLWWDAYYEEMETFIWQMLTSAKQSALTGTETGQHPMQNSCFQQGAQSFLNVVYSIWGSNRREFVGTRKTTSPATLDSTQILHTSNHTQPRIEFFSLQLSFHGFIWVSLL